MGGIMVVFCRDYVDDVIVVYDEFDFGFGMKVCQVVDFLWDGDLIFDGDMYGWFFGIIQM